MPQLEANYKKFLGGKKRGEQQQNCSIRPATKQHKGSIGAANVNVNDNVNEKKIHTRFNHLCLSIVTSLRT